MEAGMEGLKILAHMVGFWVEKALSYEEHFVSSNTNQNKHMNGLLVFIFLLSLVGLVVGLIKPSAVKLKSRKYVGYAFGGTAMIFMILVGITAPPQSDNNPDSANNTVQSNTVAQNQPAQTPVAEVANASSSQGLTAADRTKVVSLLAQNVNDYAQIYAIGQKALGTTQYANGFAGLQAMNDPSSSASQFSAFNQEWPKFDMFDKMMGVYRQASDIYYTDNAPEDTLDSWRDDMNQLDSDISSWTSTAVNWQVKGATDAQLQQAEQKISVDFETANSDIEAIKAQ